MIEVDIEFGDRCKGGKKKQAHKFAENDLEYACSMLGEHKVRLIMLQGKHSGRAGRR